MKRRRIFCVVLTAIMMLGSISAYGYSYSAQGKKRGKTYTVRNTGSNSTFYAVGNTSKVYTNIVNNKTIKIYIKSYVQKFEHGKNVYTNKIGYGQCEPGYMIVSGEMSRDYNNDIFDYIHSGETYKSSFESASMHADNYVYKAYQYYQ